MQNLHDKKAAKQMEEEEIIFNGISYMPSEIRRRLNNCYSEYHDVIIFLSDVVAQEEPQTIEEYKVMRESLANRIELMLRRLNSYINPPSEFS
jgi:hypothetical protein